MKIIKTLKYVHIELDVQWIQDEVRKFWDGFRQWLDGILREIQDYIGGWLVRWFLKLLISGLLHKFFDMFEWAEDQLKAWDDLWRKFNAL